MSDEISEWKRAFPVGGWVFHAWSFRGNLMVKVVDTRTGVNHHPPQREHDRWVNHLCNGGDPEELLREMGLTDG